MNRVAAGTMRLQPKVFDCAESALLVDFGPVRDTSLSLAIFQISERLYATGLEGYRESIPGLSSLTICYDPLLLSKERLVEAIESACETLDGTGVAARLWTIPCLYGGATGPDLGDVARAAGISEAEVIALHAGEVYVVSMLGFLPGFAYLSGLPERLRLPRRATPRARVPAGSVAIAADMTAVYPLESPGGWHLIGWSPVPMWDMARRDAPLLRPGDHVRFQPVGADEADALTRRVAEGWLPSPEAPA